MNRLDRLSVLLRIENGSTLVSNRPFELPEPLPRFIGLERNTFGDPLRVHFGETPEEVSRLLEKSNTKLGARVLVFDLDLGTCFVPVWTVSHLEEVPGPLDHTTVMRPALVHGIRALLSA
jgi:hypothetical protein